jgi:PKHD-type hydroxylase
MIYHNYVSILQKYLTKTEVDYIHAYAHNLEVHGSRTGGGAPHEDDDSEKKRAGEKGNNDSVIRQSTNKWIDHNDPKFDQTIKQKIFDGMVQANIQSNWNFEVDDMEHWQYTHYAAQPDRPTGDFYTWHTDAGADPYPQGNIRKISCSVQLSEPDDYEGGHFQWIESNKIFDRIKQRDGTFNIDEFIHTAPMSGQELGSLIVFPSWLHHQVTPVTSGLRQSLVVWNTGWPLK